MCRRVATGAAVLALLATAACSPPWTVRRIHEEAAFNPAEYAARIWDSKLVPAIAASAVAAEQFRATRPGVYAVKGTGKVLAVDTASRAGTLALDLAPYDGGPDLTLQIGPVLRGYAVRDAAGVVRFSDFVNQIQFADAGNALNARALSMVLQPVHPAGLAGRTVEFLGVFEFDPAHPAIRDVVPVRLAVVP
jgi:predicted lipoprotein